jgi:hypothetical protein
MKALNQAFEDVGAFEQFRESLEKRNDVLGFPDDRRFNAIPQRRDGENRSDWRARVKAERKAQKRTSVRKAAA